MELRQINFGYLLKNILISSKQEYLKATLSKLEHFIKRLRWRAFFFDHKNEDTIEEYEMYGFKSENTPPQHEGLAALEEELYAMIKSIKFKQISNTFQSRLANDITKNQRFTYDANSG